MRVQQIRRGNLILGNRLPRCARNDDIRSVIARKNDEAISVTRTPPKQKNILQNLLKIETKSINKWNKNNFSITGLKY